METPLPPPHTPAVSLLQLHPGGYQVPHQPDQGAGLALGLHAGNPPGLSSACSLQSPLSPLRCLPAWGLGGAGRATTAVPAAHSPAACSPHTRTAGPSCRPLWEGRQGGAPQPRDAEGGPVSQQGPHPAHHSGAPFLLAMGGSLPLSCSVARVQAGVASTQISEHSPYLPAENPRGGWGMGVPAGEPCPCGDGVGSSRQGSPKPRG